MQSTLEKLALVLIASVTVGLIVWGIVGDFRAATITDFWPIGLFPVSIAAYWIIREQRLKADIELWHAVLASFPNADFPGNDFDPQNDGAGWMTARGPVNFGRVLSQVCDRGIHLRKGFNHSRFFDKLIPWTEIACLRYMPEDFSGKFGKGSRGHAGVEFMTPRSLQLVVPWRESFNASVPDRIALQEMGTATR